MRVGHDELRRLYLDEGLSLSAIAARCGCSLTTVWRWLKAAEIPAREAGSHVRYARQDFSGNVREKAYLAGFRIGDLHVARDSHGVVIKCTSTRPEQIELFRLLFEQYGHVYTDEATMARRRRQTVGMSVRLNRSFDFLLLKEDRVPEWVLERDDTFFAFFAGYMDAEGYVNTYLPRGYVTPQCRVEVRSYDAMLLDQLAAGLNARGIACPPARLRVQAGYVNRAGVRSNRALWGLGICRKDSLLELFARIEPYLRHGRRRRDMLDALANLLSR
jgi:AcrR family transcriptional regulator